MKVYILSHALDYDLYYEKILGVYDSLEKAQALFAGAWEQQKDTWTKRFGSYLYVITEYEVS